MEVHVHLPEQPVPAAVTGPAPSVLSGRRLQLATPTLCANPATVLPALCLLLFPLLGREHLEARKHVSSTVVLEDTPAVPGTVSTGEICGKEGMSKCTVAHSDSLGQCHGDTAAFRNMPTSPITIWGLRASAWSSARLGDFPAMWLHLSKRPSRLFLPPL